MGKIERILRKLGSTPYAKYSHKEGLKGCKMEIQHLLGVIAVPSPHLNDNNGVEIFISILSDYSGGAATTSFADGGIFSERLRRS